MSNSVRSTHEFSLKPLAVALAVALGVPGTALAEAYGVPLTAGADMSRYSDNFVEAGIGYTNEDSYKFGEFNGLEDKGAFFIGNFNVRKRFGDGRNYLNAWGYNIGLDNRDLYGEYGRQGLYDVNIGYQQIPRNQFDDTQFIHEGLGGERLTLPSGFPGIDNNAFDDPGSVTPFLRDYNVKQERDIFRLGGGFKIAGWDIGAKYRQDDRDGSKIIGAVMGNSGGNPRAALLPWDLNDKTQQFEVFANWGSKVAQVNLSYWYSKYDNSTDSLSWQNPYNTINGWTGNVGFPSGYGRLGLMPDNDFHQFAGTGAWNLGGSTRLTGTVSYSIMKQDEAFQPYTINTADQTPGTTLTVPNALPRGSLDGEIKNTLIDLSLLTRPLRGLSLKANYHYNKHDNKTPNDLYGYVGGDTTNQDEVIAQDVESGRIRRNLSPGTTENKFKVDGDYTLMRGLQLRGWYEYKKVDYKPSDEELRADTNNNQFGVELRKGMSAFNGSLRYVYDRRRGSDYSTSRPYAASYTQAEVEGNPVDNLTTLRHYFVSDYDRNAIRATANIEPMERVSVSFRADWYKLDYKGPDCGGSNDQVLLPDYTFPSECLGREEAVGQSYTIDGSWTPVDGWNAFAFYTYSQFKTDQMSRQWQGNNIAQAVDSNRNWNANLKYDDNTLGLGVRFIPVDKRWDAGVQYVYSNGTGKTDLSPGPSLSATDVPDTKTKLNSFQLFGKFQYSKNILLRANYWYERYRTDDWAYDGGEPTASNRAILTGHESPDYSANVFGVSVSYTGF